MGKFTFFPSAVMEFGRTNNVLLLSDDLDPIASGVFVARINLLMDMPFGAHQVRWAYAPQYKSYSTEQFLNDDPMSHFFDFESSFQIGRSFRVGFVERYVRGVTEVQEFDPGGERVFGLSPFTLNEPRLNMELRFGSRQRLVVSPRYSSARFEDDGAALRYSYEIKALDARYGFRVSQPTEVYAYISREDTEQTRTGQFIGDSQLLTEAAGIGFSRSVNDSVVTGFSTAYTRVHVEEGEGLDFSGMAFEAIGNWDLTSNLGINLTGSRSPYQSFFLNNAFYVNNKLSVRMIHQFGSRTYWQALAGYQVNEYPSGLIPPPGSGDTWLPSVGVKRQDDSADAQIGVSYRLSSSLGLFVGYTYRQRRSNMRQCLEPVDMSPPPNTNTNGMCDGQVIAPFSFTDDQVVVRLEAGWL